jgi:hypothetical protein
MRRRASLTRLPLHSRRCINAGEQLPRSLAANRQGTRNAPSKPGGQKRRPADHRPERNPCQVQPQRDFGSR